MTYIELGSSNLVGGLDLRYNFGSSWPRVQTEKSVGLLIYDFLQGIRLLELSGYFNVNVAFINILLLGCPIGASGTFPPSLTAYVLGRAYVWRDRCKRPSSVSISTNLSVSSS